MAFKLPFSAPFRYSFWHYRDHRAVAKDEAMSSIFGPTPQKRIAGPLLLALLSILAGCSEGYEICSAPITENCRTFRSRAHYERWVKDESRRQKAAAEHFPDDYRDIVAATLKEYLQNNESEFPNHREQYFVSVFGEDADGATLAKLQQLGIEALPGSKYVPSAMTPEFQDSQGVHLNNSEVYVSDMKRLASGAYRIEFGYNCGMLCAGHLAFRLRKEGGVWVFTSKKGLISS
jgi:hypothetical protein